MNAVTALAKLRAIGVDVIRTSDAATALRQKTSAATRTLSRLARAGLIARVRHGVWVLEADADPLRLTSQLTAPFGSYVSLQSALYQHAMIDQVPAVHYVVSLARTQTIVAGRATFSIHHITPALFGGFVIADGVAMASPEKAVFDIAYLSGGRSRLFTHLPEVELPRKFDRRVIDHWTKRVRSQRGRTLVRSRLKEWLG